MGNRVSCLKAKNESASITLAIIGPDDAGKTTLSSFLAGDPVDPSVAPTVGFSNVKFTMKKFDITMYDIGGGKNIRPIWKNYFNEIYGIVYMVDSSSPARVKEARDLLRDTLEHPQVSGKPLLVLANKADVDGHMEEVDILNQLDLDHTVNANNCPSHFVMISALQSSKAKMKKVINGGFMWLLGTIHSSLDKIEPRVKEDMQAMKEMRDKEREERRERVRRQREEREKLEDQERKRLGISKEQESEEEEIKGDPFKPLDYNKLKLKEEKLKAEKKKRQELAASKLGSRDRNDLLKMKDDASIGYSMDDTMTLPRFGKQGSRFGRTADLDGLDISHSSALMLSGRHTRPTALPPLESVGSQHSESKLSEKKKGKKKKASAEDGLEPIRNGEADLYGRSGLSLHGSRSFIIGKPFTHERDEDSLRMARDDLLRRSDFALKGSRSYADNEYEREMPRNGEGLDSLGRLDFPLVSSSHSDPHDLTPRVAKPRNSKFVKTGRIDEDENEESSNQYRNMRLSLKEYGDPRMTQKLDEYRDKYSLRSSSDTKALRSSENKYPSDTYGKEGRRWDKSLEREDSMYRKSLKNISPPDLDRFDEDDNEDYKDEGIEDDSESEDLGCYSQSYSRGKYGSYGTHGRKERGKKKDENANNRRMQYNSDEDEDEEENYRSKNVLKNTLRFSRHDDEEEDGRRYEKEINNLRHRRTDYKSGYNKDGRFNKDAMGSDDDRSDRQRSRTPEQLDQRRKKKKNILKSNKLMPSDDDDDDNEVKKRMSQYYTSPRLVQECGSRNTSDADTPSKGRNSRTTYFHSSSSRESDLGRKWGLAEDLPAIDNDSRVHRNMRPNFDDSEGEDVIF